MRRSVRLHLGPNHLFGAVALLLAWLAVWPWIMPIAAPVPPSRMVAAPVLNIPALPAPAAFAAIGERPLFSASRRPATAVSNTVSSTAARYRLLGLITVGGARHGLVADGARRVEVGEGTALGGWTVTRIEPDRVVLSSPQGEAMLTLERAGEPADAAAGPPHSK